jgi:hypothetical protein
MLDSNGNIYLNKSLNQLLITIAQKNKLLLDQLLLLYQLLSLYGGNIYGYSKTESYKWILYRKQDIFNILHYF